MRDRAWTVPVYLLAIVLLIIQVSPIVWVGMSSMKTSAQLLESSPLSLPSPPSLEHYQSVIELGNIGVYFKNTAIVTVLTVLTILALSSTAAFAIEKMRFGANKAVMNFFLFGILIPIQVALIPMFMMYNSMNMLNTYWGLVIPQVAFALPVAIFLFVGFYSYFPNELMEAAAIDGCGILRLFLQIVIPMSINTVITIITLYGVYSWNEFIFAFTFLSKKSMLTLTLGLRDFVGNYGLIDWGKTFAAITLTVTPTLIIYFFFSKYIIKGISDGSVK